MSEARLDTDPLTSFVRTALIRSSIRARICCSSVAWPVAAAIYFYWTSLRYLVCLSRDVRALQSATLDLKTNLKRVRLFKEPPSLNPAEDELRSPPEP